MPDGYEQLHAFYKKNEENSHGKNNGQNCLYCSYWKVYDNLSQTKKIFEVYDKVRFQMVKLVEYGKSFKELVDMYTNYQVPRYA